MSQEKIHELINYIVLGITGGSAGAVTFIDSLAGIGTLVVQLISIITFICFYLMNQDKINQGWLKFKNKFKNKFKKGNNE